MPVPPKNLAKLLVLLGLQIRESGGVCNFLARKGKHVTQKLDGHGPALTAPPSEFCLPVGTSYQRCSTSVAMRFW